MELDDRSLGAASRIRWGAGMSLGLLGMWLLLDGVESWPLGAAAGLVGGWVGSVLVPGRPLRLHPIRLIGFFGFFVDQSLRGGIDVAWRALQPDMPIQPGFVEYPVSLPPGPPTTLMMAVVSLLPGTLSADFDAEQNVLCVHVLAPEMASSLEPLEQHILRLFALETNE